MKYNVTIYFINTLFMPITVLCFVILIAHPEKRGNENQKLPQSAINFNFDAMIYMFITYSNY